jgi:hypothetical protein
MLDAVELPGGALRKLLGLGTAGIVQRDITRSRDAAVRVLDRLSSDSARKFLVGGTLIG